jgi:DNA (cytosine-5)-methyltransferase 1
MSLQRRRKVVLVADLFCGAGGSSTGAERAIASLGQRMKLVALNHWSVAVATHQKNHPHAKHFLVDVYKTKPRDAVPGGRLDLLMASPTCTFFSRARGGKPISREQRFGRMTPVQVLRWCAELDVRCLLVENVPEFQHWGPVSRRTGMPIREKRGLYFRAWVRRLERLGYAVEWRALCAADYGDATTRQRFFLLARKDGEPIAWPAPSHSKDGSTGARWRPAREIIDWSIPGKSIFSRERPLSPKTLARIYAGAVKFRWPEPFLVVLRQHMSAQGLDAPLPTITAGGTHLGRAQPRVVRSAKHRRNALCVRDAEQPIPTVTTDGGLAVAEAVILPQNGSNPPRSAERPAPTITTTSRGIGLAQPVILPQGGGGAARPVDEPVATVTTDGAHALIAPYYGATQAAKSSGEPLPTVTARDRFGLVTPVTHADDSGRARSLEEPLPTVTAAPRGELAFIAAAFGERPTQAPRVHSIDEPAPTICATGRVQLVEGEQAAERVDVLFRMLQPHELAAAMGFSDEESTYEFVGTKEQVTKQIGNAVPVRTASALVKALLSPPGPHGPGRIIDPLALECDMDPEDA